MSCNFVKPVVTILNEESSQTHSLPDPTDVNRPDHLTYFGYRDTIGWCLPPSKSVSFAIFEKNL